MKIEIGESMLLSWLRHAKNCQTVQMNWKVSPLWDIYNEDKIDLVMKEVNEKFQNQVEDKIKNNLKGHQINIFKQNSGYDQVLKQGEIDLVGVDSKGVNLGNIYVVDVAFHEKGLGYGKNKGENISKVLGKMIRSALILYGFFNVTKGTVIFASPKIHKGVYEPLQISINELNAFFNNLSYIDKFNFEFKLYANDSFKENILGIVDGFSSAVSDTSELYLRSVQMKNIFNHEKSDVKQNATKTAIATTYNTLDQAEDELPIGKLVKNEIFKLFENNAIDKRTIEELSSKDDSKEVLGINYPLFKKVDKGLPLSEQTKGPDGRARYWMTTVEYQNEDNEEEYLICSQWFDYNRDKFLSWLNQNNK